MHQTQVVGRAVSKVGRDKSNWIGTIFTVKLRKTKKIPPCRLRREMAQWAKLKHWGLGLDAGRKAGEGSKSQEAQHRRGERR